MRYAQIILPVPLFSFFTYSVPEEMEGGIFVGSRVLVQFGKKKFYTGIIAGFSNEAPGNYEIKPIMALLDESPILRYPQLNLWEWISNYYLCSQGDVFKAALPTGLKPESETWISLNPDFDFSEAIGISEKETQIITLLDNEKKLKLSDLEEKLKINRNSTLISKMLDKGILEIAETIAAKYRAKTILCIKLSINLDDPDSLHSIFDAVGRAPQQEKALIAYIDILKDKESQEPHTSIYISREELMARSGVSLAVINAMRDKGIFEIYKLSINRFNRPIDDTLNLSPLSPIQKEALDSIISEWQNKNVVLFRGITGSGKTEIYTHLINSTLTQGNQVLFLVPEISLTTQLTDRLRAVFGTKLLVYHSRFSDNERVDLWKKLLHTNDPYVVIGARSAIFLPFARLGLIVIDEEHDVSYKQYDPAPRYNARDSAIILAKMHGAKTLLGSATPSIESYYKAKNGKYGLVELEERFDDSVLPEVKIVDMSQQRKTKSNIGILSEPLVLATKKALEEKKQILMFQNRRGFAPVEVCKSCGWSPKCQNCDVSLVYHKNTDSLHCHYCGFSMSQPSLCPACGENDLEIYGYGTQRIEEEIKDTFPEAKLSRMDLDSTRNKNAYHDIISEFSSNKTDILVGTQMLTKGLDFGNVRVVGVLNADTVLNHPDFRSNERAFNILEQVAGRAGRRKETGRVLIQTSATDNPILEFVKTHDYKAYYEAEIRQRAELNYPPFSKLIMVYIKNKDALIVDSAAQLLAESLRNIFKERVLGPQKPYISRIANFYLQQIMLKIENGASLSKVKAILRNIYESLARDSRIKSSILYYDVDPM